jgi:hypothetical protein
MCSALQTKDRLEFSEVAQTDERIAMVIDVCAGSLSKSQTPRSKSQGNIKLQSSKRTGPAQSHFLAIEVRWWLSFW